MPKSLSVSHLKGVLYKSGTRIPSSETGISWRLSSKGGSMNVKLKSWELKCYAVPKLGTRRTREEMQSLNGSLEMTASHFILSIDGGNICK
jgi:hypothetical protein